MIDAKTVRNRVFAQPSEVEKRTERYITARAALEAHKAEHEKAPDGVTKLLVASQVGRAEEELDFATRALKEWLCTLPRQQYRDGFTVYHVDRTGTLHIQKTGRRV